MKAETTFSLKDQLFNPEKVAYLADLISEAHADFPNQAFQEDVVTFWTAVERKSQGQPVIQLPKEAESGEMVTSLQINN